MISILVQCGCSARLESVHPHTTDHSDATGLSAARWNQDAFFISFWVGPQVAEDDLETRFAEIAEANFTGYVRTSVELMAASR